MGRDDRSPAALWTAGAAIAIGIGVGAALAASMGAVGWALGLLVGLLPLAVGRVRRSRR